MFLNGNFVALAAFKERYGVQVAGEVGKTIPTKWQSSLFQAGQCGAFIGVFLAGPITNRLGYRWTTLLALMLMNATIFISFFVSIPTLIWIQRLTILRRIRWRFSSLGKLSKVSHGACSSPTRRRTPVRSFLWFFVVPVRLLFRCLGLSEASLSLLRPTATTSETMSGRGEVLWPYSGCSL